MITYGGSLWKALEAAEQLAEEGIEAEVLDLRSLRPLDTPSILASVAKTHRALVVDEGWRTGSLAAEISAQIMEGAFYDLDGPVAQAVQRRGADAVREAPRRRGPAPGGDHRRRDPGDCDKRRG